MQNLHTLLTLFKQAQITSVCEPPPFPFPRIPLVLKTDQPNLNDSVNFRFNLHFAFLAQLLKYAESFPRDQPFFKILYN